MKAPDWRDFPSLSSLRAFEATARLGGFSAAARTLNVTHAAIAQQVRALEAELGLTLVQRDGRGIVLTMEGTHLAAALADGFATIAAGIATVRSGTGNRGLRISATPALTQSILLPKLGEFWAAHPDVAVSLTPGYDLVDLRRDGYDIAIRSGGGNAGWPGVEAELLAWSQYILVGAPGLVARDPDVMRLPWIGPLDRHEAQLLRDSGIDSQTVIVNSIDMPVLSVPAAVQGLGLLFVADIVVRADLRAGRLVQLPFRELPRFAYWLVTLPGPRRPAVAAFIDWLRSLLATDGEG